MRPEPVARLGPALRARPSGRRCPAGPSRPAARRRDARRALLHQAGLHDGLHAVPDPSPGPRGGIVHDVRVRVGVTVVPAPRPTALRLAVRVPPPRRRLRAARPWHVVVGVQVASCVLSPSPPSWHQNSPQPFGSNGRAQPVAASLAPLLPCWDVQACRDDILVSSETPSASSAASPSASESSAASSPSAAPPSEST